MPKRTGERQGFDPLVTGKIYHVYNRVIDGAGVLSKSNSRYSDLLLKVFDHCKKYCTTFSQHAKIVAKSDPSDFLLQSPANTSGKCLEADVMLERHVPVKIHAYCIMPNHFHLLVEQLIDGGLSHYMKRSLSGFTQIYNKDGGRRGPLWEGRFRGKLVDSNESYMQVVRYIHLNPLRSSRLNVPDLGGYPFSSILEVMGGAKYELCDLTFFRTLFASNKEYQRFVLSQMQEGESALLQTLSLEEAFID